MDRTKTDLLSFGRVAIAAIVPASWRQGCVDNGHRAYLHYAFRKSERPVLTKQAMEYLIKSGKVQLSLSGIKPGITLQRYHTMYHI